MSHWDDHLDAIMSDRYASLVAYAALLTAGDRAAAEDLAQEAIVKTFSRGRGFESVSHAERYTRRAIATLSIDGARSRARWLRVRPRIAQAATASAHADAVDAAVDMRAALAALSPRERACVVLRHYDDLTVDQTADRLRLAPGTVKRYLADAHRKLGLELTDHKPEIRVVATPARKGN